MKISERIDALVQLGEHLLQPDDYLEAVMHRSLYHNGWFTIENQQRAVKAIATHLLNREKLEAWAATYHFPEPALPKNIGLVMAGNIPLVGFHDLLCVFVAGHKALVKQSEKDQYLLPYLLKLLARFNPATEAYFQITDRMAGFDAVVATGSNNSARYFETYFGKVPNIIRKNRNAVAVLTGDETPDQLRALGKDVFRYFGLGCRNVSKLYLPQGYDFQLLLENLHHYREIILHDKYLNNFDYNLALLMMNRTTYWNNGCIILLENESIASRIALLHFEHYPDLPWLHQELEKRKEEIQCVVASGISGLTLPVVSFGEAQEPSLHDYADGVDTMSFLTGL